MKNSDMKKTINMAFYYAILAMISGVFYREFTKLQGFTGRTALSFVHTHLFLLGMVMLLIVTIMIAICSLHEAKRFRAFLWTYNIGVCITAIMLALRGILQVTAAELSSGMDAMISGFSGIGHILVGIGIILFFLNLKERIQG